MGLTVVKTARAFRRRAIPVVIRLTSVFILRAFLTRVMKKILDYQAKNKRKKTPSTLFLLAQELTGDDGYDYEEQLPLAA